LRRSARRRAAGLALAALLAGGRAWGAVEGFQYTREVEVPAAGWVRVPLDQATLQHLAPAAVDLHVFGPGGGEVPPELLRVTAGEVETVSGPSLTVALRDAECDRAQPGVNVCRLELPAAGQILRRLSVEIAVEGPVGYRLDQPRDSRWLPLAEGVWQREGLRTSHQLAGSREPIAGSTLRLELYGAGEVAPRLVSYGAELALPTVLFQAVEPGRYTLAYGGAARASVERAGSDGDGGTAAWLEAGPEREHPLAPLPASATAPGTALREADFAAGWRVIAPAAKPGDLIRLDLPDAVYAAARPDLGDLRLTVGGRQIPFYLGSPAPPVPLVEERGLKPAPRERSQDESDSESEIEIRLPEPGLPLTELYLTLPGMPLRRTVGVRYLEPAPPGARKRERSAVARQTWECVPEPPLPCRLGLPLSGPATALLSVRFHDGDNPPLTGLQATVWRRGDVLLFVWPAAAEAEDETPVRLLAGREGLSAPSYDLAALGESLLGRPWQPAELDLEGAASPEAPWWSRWVLPITLGIAGIFLVLLLRRILTEA
jgi:hypothetical protein